MITEERFIQILAKLLRRSEADEVGWKVCDDMGGGYEVEFDPWTKIQIAYYSPTSAPDCVTAFLWVKGEIGTRLEAEDGDITYHMLFKLYTEADRIVRGWDKALETIEEALDSEKPIGKLGDDEPYHPNDSSDIPF